MSIRLRSLVVAALVAPLALAAGQERTSEAKWSEQLTAGHTLRANNLNGRIIIGRASGDRVEVTATKRWRRGNPDDVKIVTKKDGDDVVVCALWGSMQSCNDSYDDNRRGRFGRWSDRNDDNNDVQVDFTINIPKGVRVNAGSVNGGVSVSGATADVDVATVNGGIDVDAGAGRIRASTVNGAVHARVTAEALSSDLEFATVNGSVIAELPANLGADVGMTTVNGSLRSDYDITIHGRIDPSHLSAHVGPAGGPRITLTTVNGNVELRKL